MFYSFINKNQLDKLMFDKCNLKKLNMVKGSMHYYKRLQYYFHYSTMQPFFNPIYKYCCLIDDESDYIVVVLIMGESDIDEIILLELL